MKEIPLTHGYITIVDDEDYEYLSQFKWWAMKKGNYIYAERSNYCNKTKKSNHMKMHREIMKVTDKSILVDHIDRNPLNNQKSNLRLCNKQQNAANSKKRKGGSSKYRGVSLCWDRKNRYIARLYYKGRNYHLGRFKTEIEAAKAYNEKALELYGEFANLNIF